MKIFENLDSWRAFRRSLNPGICIGFVPTMGNLHVGHASLYMKCKAENDCTVASIFVNPTQFNQAQDFKTYPRTLEADCEILEQQGVDYCLLPNEAEIYADGYRYQMIEQELCQLMEGEHRPGHFNGVLTVVLKLLLLTKPQNLYLGEKDYQQYLLIKGMVSSFFMDIAVIACPTVRESSGLAYSSRNSRLNPEQRQLAEKFAYCFQQEKSCALITQELQALGIEVDYLLEYQGRRFAAVSIGGVRLIDNFSLS